ncbi:hypothetical protein [Lichenibacterium dinghuense]|uniref:hypothetical protein n=1 Tax=Lichenibacterium dinghuense TaxID=2895977 RepID=UPI001F38FA50|nr:hypothetical protein [Lichenibacterium sp. 6Y81]
MTHPTPPCWPTLSLLPIAVAAAWAGAAAPARAADLPFFPAPPPIYGAQSFNEPAFGGGGFRVARVPVRPAPMRYDIYGYPLLPGVPSPLAVGNGCPVAVQPDYDADGNFAGYAPIPMCR